MVKHCQERLEFAKKDITLAVMYNEEKKFLIEEATKN